jgi:F420-0:gamma-glutamyl ligase-like protein
VKLQEHLDLDKQTGYVDVSVLDVLTQIETLLRDAQQIQRRILRVRGVPQVESVTRRRVAAAEVQKLARSMSQAASVLSEMCKELEHHSASLKRTADEPH